jgi:hypothetical protein
MDTFIPAYITSKMKVIKKNLRNKKGKSRRSLNVPHTNLSVQYPLFFLSLPIHRSPYPYIGANILRFREKLSKALVGDQGTLNHGHVFDGKSMSNCQTAWFSDYQELLTRVLAVFSWYSHTSERTGATFTVPSIYSTTTLSNITL